MAAAQQNVSTNPSPASAGASLPSEQQPVNIEPKREEDNQGQVP